MKLSILIPVYNQEELVIKALDNIPRRDDIEVIVRDDGSTDETYIHLKSYMETHQDLKMMLYANGENKGVAYTKNRLLESASGEYIHIHDSDDYVYTENYNSLIDQLDGADIYCMDLVVNDGKMLELNDQTKKLYCAQIARIIRREFAKGISFPEDVRAGDDWFFANALLERNPVTVYTGIPAYHYNFPREGSLCDLRLKGILP